MTTLGQSWSRAWHNLQLPAPAGLLDQLLTAYSEPKRHYHTQQHLLECLSHFFTAIDAATHAGEVELALWFHDAVYDIHGHNNEHLSAQWAVQVLTQAGADAGTMQRVHELIMATCHDAAPATPDAQLLVDIDLSILGAPAARFDEYDHQVQAEYSWVPSAIYFAKRKEILSGFLARPFIYSTQHFRDRYEMQARANLTNLVDKLASTRMSLPEHSRLVFHDSEVSSIDTSADTVVIRFSAAVVHGKAEASGPDKSAGYLQSVALVCLGVEAMQVDPGCIGRLSNGMLTTHGLRMSAVSLPYATSNACSLELEFTNGSRVTLSASGMHLKLSDDSRFIESFAC